MTAREWILTFIFGLFGAVLGVDYGYRLAIQDVKKITDPTAGVSRRGTPDKRAQTINAPGVNISGNKFINAWPFPPGSRVYWDADNYEELQPDGTWQKGKKGKRAK